MIAKKLIRVWTTFDSLWYTLMQQIQYQLADPQSVFINTGALPPYLGYCQGRLVEAANEEGPGWTPQLD